MGGFGLDSSGLGKSRFWPLVKIAPDSLASQKEEFRFELFYDNVSNSMHSMELWYIRKEADIANSSYYPCIFLDGLIKSWCRRRDSNPVPLTYKSRALPLRLPVR
jgi:hypothetical protein